MKKRILVGSDFDETIVEQNTPKLLAAEMIKFYKKTFGVWYLPGKIARVIKATLGYKLTGKTKHFYTEFFYFDEHIVDKVVRSLSFKQKWVRKIAQIRKDNGGAEIDLVIISRNIQGVIRKFVDMHHHAFERMGVTVKEIIAHADILEGEDTIIRAGVWNAKNKELVVDMSGLTERPIARKELVRMAAIERYPEDDMLHKIHRIIEKNKRDYLAIGKGHTMYYLADAEDRYMGKHKEIEFVEI